MNNQHPITPPFELVQQWINEGDGFTEGYFATQAARWGADQQLAKDAEWLDQHALDAPHLKITPVGESLKEAMRPKPPSLKEQALSLIPEVCGLPMMRTYSPDELLVLRRALETLDD
jgi:hypothetical protein